jgi:hypothetical protein
MSEEAQVLPEGESTRHASTEAQPDVGCIFDLGGSGGANIAEDKHSMIGEAFDSLHKKA